MKHQSIRLHMYFSLLIYHLSRNIHCSEGQLAIGGYSIIVVTSKIPLSIRNKLEKCVFNVTALLA